MDEANGLLPNDTLTLFCEVRLLLYIIGKPLAGKGNCLTSQYHIYVTPLMHRAYTHLAL